MKNIIFDCDPGHDDVMAILCALAHPGEFNIIGFVTVCGNQTVDKVTVNLTRVLSFLNKKYDVVRGSAKPLVYDAEPQPSAHGESGLDGPDLKEGLIKEKRIDFLEYLKKSLNEETTILALGPLTNIAKLIKKYPEVRNNIEEIVIMGGSINGGNILPSAEFNIYADPHSAKTVFESGINIVLAPLEACDYCCINHKLIDSLKDKGYVSNFAYEILDFFSIYSKNKGSNKSPVFDLTCVMYILYPETFEGFKADVEVVLEGDNRGQTIFKKNEKGNVYVLTKADNRILENNFVNDLELLDREFIG